MPVVADNDPDVSRSSSGHAFVTITNPDVEVTLPELGYGYRTTKATWEELVRIIGENEIPKLTRSRKQQHLYEVFRFHMKAQYASTLDYILISKFGFAKVLSSSPAAADKDGGGIQPRWKADPCLEDDAVGPRLLLAENDFPYCIEDNVVHYVLWKLKEPIVPQEILDARETLQSDKIKALEILEWVNPPNLKSIPEIDHVHFLCRF